MLRRARTTYSFFFFFLLVGLLAKLLTTTDSHLLAAGPFPVCSGKLWNPVALTKWSEENCCEQSALTPPWCFPRSICCVALAKAMSSSQCFRGNEERLTKRLLPKLLLRHLLYICSLISCWQLVSRLSMINTICQSKRLRLMK